MPTKVEWADETWNPVTGCAPVSPGCQNCYARRMATRLAGRYGYPKDDPFRVTFHPDRLAEPLVWRKPRRIFVCSMSDPFHPEALQYLPYIFRAAKLRPQHTFMLLTKRPENIDKTTLCEWLPNVWLGVTAENQAGWDKRVPILLDTPAAVRFVSVEPQIELIVPGLNLPNWVIQGAETGPGKRAFDLDWARAMRDKCKEARVPYFFKKDGQGNHELDGRVHESFPGEGV